MLSSIVLLLALQYLWLQKVYDDGLDAIRKESNLLLRNSIRSLQDSLFQRNIVLLDSAGESIPGNRFRFRALQDSLRFNLPPDSIRSIQVNREKERVEIILRGTGNGDSLRQVIASPMRSFMENEPGLRSLVFRAGLDSLRSSDIRRKFSKALTEADLQIPFEIKKIQRGQAYVPEQKNAVVTEPVPVNPFEMWMAIFPQPGKKILAEMLPQFLFCLFLSLITIGSFYVMHSNIRSQQRLMQIKNELISNITHELKTPVATVSVALEAIRNFNVIEKPELTKEYLDIAQNELNRLNLMTDKILKTALFEEKGLSFDKEDFDLAALCEDIISTMKLAFEKHHAKVSFTKEGDTFHFSGSKIHLSNVIYNLLDNALKYSKEGVAIDIRLKSANNHYLISVADTGFGIPEEYHQKIFEKFFRLPMGDIHNTKGYGLGLSYVASVVEGHQGSIELESSVGEGSCFTISLPRNSHAA